MPVNTQTIPIRFVTKLTIPSQSDPIIFVTSFHHAGVLVEEHLNVFEDEGHGCREVLQRFQVFLKLCFCVDFFLEPIFNNKMRDSLMRDLSSMVGGGKVGVGVRGPPICGINKKQPSRDRSSFSQRIERFPSCAHTGFETCS